jgi:uncharacterized protein (TIGR02594 family)
MTWLSIARKYDGVREIPGPSIHPTIQGWANALGGWVAKWFVDDATPWCALFAWRVMQEAGFPIKSGAALVRAKAFVDYGTALETPTLGCILVFDRAGGGHVGFYVGETDKAFLVYGGNQDDSVKETPIAKSRCVAMRWPPGALLPVKPIRVVRKLTGTLSVNER